MDTNVLVSGVAYPKSVPGHVVQLCQSGAVELVLSRYILDEFSRVLWRFPHLNLTPGKMSELIETFVFLARMVEPGSAVDPDLRDPADQQVLATFRAADADYLITGDKDLLALAERYPILTPAAFWLRHG